MRKRTQLSLLLLVVVALASCGGHSSSASSNAQVQKATSFVDSAIARCLPKKDGAPDPFVLRNKAKRKTVEACAIPPGKRVAFDTCLTKVVLSGIPTKTRLEKGVEKCLAEAGA